MFYIVFGLLFVAFSGLMLITALRIEANSLIMQENTRVLLRVEQKLAPESTKEPVIPSKPAPDVIAVSAPIPTTDAEIQAILRRPNHDTLVQGTEPPRDTVPNEMTAAEMIDDDDDRRPTTIVPRCAQCGSVNYVPTGGLFTCQSCKKTGYLTFHGLEQRKVA
jgi:hypothetical protein